MEDKRDRLLSITEFSDALGITTAGTRRWLLERRISHVKVGRLVRIPQSELDRIIEEGFRPARPSRQRHTAAPATGAAEAM